MRPRISRSLNKSKLSTLGGKKESMEANGVAEFDRATGENDGDEKEVMDGAGGRRGGAFLVAAPALEDQASSTSS